MTESSNHPAENPGNPGAKRPGAKRPARGQPEWFVVARREFWERVHTKWFVIVTLLGPIGLAALIVVPALLQARSAADDVRVAVVDETPEKLLDVLLAPSFGLPENFRLEAAPAGATRAALSARIKDKEIDGFLLVPADAMAGGQVVYEGANASNLGLVNNLQVFLTKAAFDIRAQKIGLSDEQRLSLLMPIAFSAKQNTGELATKSVAASFILGYVVMILLYTAIILYAVNVMRSVVQEKTSRVVEIMVSAIKPRALMLGKIIGVGTVGLVQLGIWAVLGLVMLRYQGQFLGLFGVAGASDVDLPSIGVLDIAVVLAYFFGGYFFYAALYAAIGAMVNSDQEAQQAQTPVVLLLIIPVLCAQLVAGDPRGGVAEILTVIPFSSPVLMPMRYLLGGAGVADVALSLAVLMLSLAGAVFLAGRIYRVGILMYGKRPTLRELGRWLRYR